MKIYNKEMLDSYTKNDWIIELLKYNEIKYPLNGVGSWEDIPTQQWLYEAPQKRMIYADVYGDLLKSKQRKRVLDVGGGLNSLTPQLANNAEYWLLDFFSHGNRTQINEVIKANDINWIDKDWYEYECNTEWDVVIANDIFPNVDQRLEAFLMMIIPKCKELRLVVTFYNTPRFYITKRIDADEILTISAWDGEILETKLKKYILGDILPESIRSTTESVFPNGRQVAYVIIRN